MRRRRIGVLEVYVAIVFAVLFFPLVVWWSSRLSNRGICASQSPA